MQVLACSVVDRDLSLAWKSRWLLINAFSVQLCDLFIEDF